MEEQTKKIGASTVDLATAPDLFNTLIEVLKRKKDAQRSHSFLLSEMALSSKWPRGSTSLLLRHKLNLFRYHDSEYRITDHINKA